MILWNAVGKKIEAKLRLLVCLRGGVKSGVERKCVLGGFARIGESLHGMELPHTVEHTVELTLMICGESLIGFIRGVMSGALCLSCIIQYRRGGDSLRVCCAFCCNLGFPLS